MITQNTHILSHSDTHGEIDEEICIRRHLLNFMCRSLSLSKKISRAEKIRYLIKHVRVISNWCKFTLKLPSVFD